MKAQRETCKCSYTFSFILALDGVDNQCHAPAALTPTNKMVPLWQEAGWSPRLVWTGVEVLGPHRDSIPIPSTTKLSRYTAWATAAHVSLALRMEKVWRKSRISNSTALSLLSTSCVRRTVWHTFEILALLFWGLPLSKSALLTCVMTGNYNNRACCCMEGS